VLGGLADKFGVPSIVTRVLFSAMTAFTMFLPGIGLYLVLWALMPSVDSAEEPDI
jgi:phage shock protein PspC (stress-responsive transcriptional regulator)